ncbi:IS30 family transposase [Rhodoferax sp.]|uniref:IS30 family transposase n=1 Tax=Rhodoferax sp. TaxID=50421 RepID=UPI002ACDC27D|nr:IS30 family transposase [Rhodoferax sp.]MDZ7920119.1 IS30 family transposase [Rhodoferax sp.]
MTHNHLSPSERYQIQAWLELDLTKCQIALRLGRHRSTIYRELQRCEGAYNAQRAQSHRSGCALRCAANAPRYTPAVWKHVRKAMTQSYWSPQQIAGRAQFTASLAPACSSPDMPSMQTIYAWAARVWPKRDDRPLRRARPNRRCKTGPLSVFGWARSVQPIAQRPLQVRQRLQVGHWEIDTMMGMRGGYKARLLVCVERSSRYTRLVLLDNGLPETTAVAVHQRLLGDARWPVLSITTDRGSEFAKLHTVVEHERLYVCDAQRPNQRGTNENTIGLIRQFIPKGEPLSLQTPASIARIERLLNSRPRACLGFKTPAEVLSGLRNQCRDSN